MGILRKLTFKSRKVVLATAGVAFISAFNPVSAKVPGGIVRVNVNWAQTGPISNAVPTLQVVVNPLLRPNSRVGQRALKAVHKLGANDVRFVPWLPYPRLAVAELKPPANGHTSWNFSLIDPMVRAFMRATKGHSVIMNFSTIPEWMFKTPKPIGYPKNPDQVDWGYEQGTTLRKPGIQAVADYYARLVSWYTRGGFHDEFGKWHPSPFHYHIAWWEVLNEVEWEHHMTPQVYTRYYDAITAAIHKISPHTRFVGMALGTPANSLSWFEYFLNPLNHTHGAPLDMISYHFYAQPTAADKPAVWPALFFKQADNFLGQVRAVEKIRRRLSPQTLTDVDELGSILPDDTAPRLARPIPHMYWNLSGAMYAYMYAKLAAMGIHVVGESQLIGYPSQFPSVSMVNWTTGVPNARFRVLQMLVKNFGPADHMPVTRVLASSPANKTAGRLFAQAFRTPSGDRKILLVNCRDKAAWILVAGAKGATEQWVDQETGSGQPRMRRLASNRFHLGGLGVAVVTLAVGK